MLKLRYDDESDVLVIVASRAGRLSHAEEMGDIVVHLGKKGEPLVLEVLNARKNVPLMFQAIAKKESQHSLGKRKRGKKRTLLEYLKTFTPDHELADAVEKVIAERNRVRIVDEDKGTMSWCSRNRKVVKMGGLWKGLRVDDKDVDAAKKSLFREEWPETRKMRGIVNSRLSARDLEEARMEMTYD